MKNDLPGNKIRNLKAKTKWKNCESESQQPVQLSKSRVPLARKSTGNGILIFCRNITEI